MNFMPAAVDIGSHTARLLVANVFYSNGVLCLRPELVRRNYIFIASEMSSGRVIEKTSISRTVAIIKDYTDLALSHKTPQVDGIATGVIRNAVNGEAFIRRLNRIDGFNCRIISGEEEAILTAKGVLNSLKTTSDSIIFDLGGGSTEFIFLEKNIVSKIKSLPLGCMSLTKKFLWKNGKNMFLKLNEYIMDIMDREIGFYPTAHLIGTGGTVASTAAVCRDIQQDHIGYKSLHEQKISFSEVDNLYGIIINMSLAEIVNNMHIEEARAKVLPAGLSILKNIMIYAKAESLTVSMSGLLEGVILSNMEENSHEH